MEKTCKLVIIQYWDDEDNAQLMDVLFTNLGYYKKYGVVLSDKVLRQAYRKYRLEEHIVDYQEDTLDYIFFDDCVCDIFRSKKIKTLISEGIVVNDNRIHPVLLFSTRFPLKTFVTPLGLIPTAKLFLSVKEGYQEQDMDILLRFMAVDIPDGIRKSTNNHTNVNFRASRAREVSDRYDELNRDVIPQIKHIAQEGYYTIELTVKDPRVAGELTRMGYEVEVKDSNEIRVTW